MRRFLIFLAIAQTLILCWLIHTRLGLLADSLASAAESRDNPVSVKQVYRFSESEVDVWGITPGFVEGYLVGKHGTQVSISTTFQHGFGWTLHAEIDGREVTSTSLSLDTACLELLHDYHELRSPN